MRLMALRGDAIYRDPIGALFESQRWWVRRFQVGDFFDVALDLRGAKTASMTERRAIDIVSPAAEGFNKRRMGVPLHAAALIKMVETATRHLPVLAWGDLCLNREDGVLLAQGQERHLKPREQSLLLSLLFCDDITGCQVTDLCRLLGFSDAHAVAVQISCLRSVLPSEMQIVLRETKSGLCYQLYDTRQSNQPVAKKLRTIWE